MNKNKVNKKLIINKKLPQIIIPESKINMFIKWWNEDIRFETMVPHSFNEGYLILENFLCNIKNENDYRKMISKIAHSMQTTFNIVKTKFEDFLTNIQKLQIYFKFVTDNSMQLLIYDSTNNIISSASFEFGNNNAEPELIWEFSEYSNFNDFLNKFNYMIMSITVTSLWYIATTKRSTKYIYETKSPVILGRKKGVVQVSDTKFITTPIYNFNKIKTVNIKNLKSRKQGWVYSHSFLVHGHYRHYKDGKTIFIQPFIKGKNKEFKSQTVYLEPSENN